MMTVFWGKKRNIDNADWESAVNVVKVRYEEDGRGRGKLTGRLSGRAPGEQSGRLSGRAPGKVSGALNGVITIEMSYLVSIILFIFVLVIYTIFYYHDKNILNGAAAETAVLGAQIERKPDDAGNIDLAGFYQERIQGKLILFSGANAEVSVTDKQVSVNVSAVRGRMKIRAVQSAEIVIPEKKIRQKRIVEGLVREEE